MSTSTWKPDPATQRLLERVEAAALPATHTLTPVEARRAMLENGKASDMEPPPVAHVSDRTIPGPGGPLPVRCYRPREASPSGIPVLLYFHGGGFVIGDLDTHDSICRTLSLAGDAIVLSVDYRLAPEHLYPAAIEDAIGSFDWLAEHAGEIGGDPQRLAVGGDSAGGAMAAVVAQHARNLGNSALQAQLLLYPVTDLGKEYPSHVENASIFPISKPVLDWFWDHYFGPERGHDVRLEPWASPIRTQRFDGLAPAFVLTAGKDPLRDEAAAYAARLAEAGVETIYQCVLGAVHGFLRMGKVIPATHDALAAAGSFLRVRMAGLAE